MKDCIDTLLKSRYKSRPNPNSSYLLPSTPCSTRPISQLFLPSWASRCESNMYVEQENWGLVKEGKKLMPEAKSYRWKHLNWTYTTTLKDWKTKRLNPTHCWRKHNTNFDLPQIAFYLLPKCTVDFTAHPISQFFLPNWASGCEGFMCVEQEIWGFYWSRRREKAGAQCKIIQI